MSSALSHSIKNSVLLALLILIAHVAAKNHLQARSLEGLAAYGVPARPVSQQQEEAFADEPLVARAAAPSAAAAQQPKAAPPRAAAQQLEQLEEYVFGPENVVAQGAGTAHAPAPAPGPAPAAPAAVPARPDLLPRPASAAPAAPAQGPRKVGAAGEERFVNAGRREAVVGKYDDESTMCGGKLFDGGLQAFDGATESTYQLLA